MLEHIHGVARRLLPIRPLLIGLVACGVLSAAFGLFAFVGKEGDAILMPAIMLMLWAVTGLIFIDVFAHSPGLPRSHSDVWSGRLLGQLWRWFQWALVLGFATLSLTVADLSLHIADVWLLERGH
ncbi:hypothetical protein [Thiocystis violacea]|uniref:hypothetical protein n=1 Tax=Thiocystis violacea TaxID=13725 RepID=UPI00190628B0|nr:hypothetical protein [Thiocystis violacea]MBK1719997.1 hypothetical protein [Thiocystis violacea]